ncbi:FtsX-like permease family protein [Iamia majanohamensis]|uniref:FtsX-like permease family protein n=1 Tax=Iamia majanohamensis TaxID=467976 RepID=A0AAF0BWI9_9ACTN|nr:FtsX-like permease family protein [Iamia majanohamensis]WCO68093.1 FtsX-like permease family protein [Iamia majanohamensis]
MRIALRELRRRPGRFAVAAVILTLIALLLMFLGGLLDGLLASSTGAYRAQRADLVVYSDDAQDTLLRSRITPEVRDQVAAVEGVDEVGGLGTVQLGGRPGDDPDGDDLVATALFGYELAPRGLPEEPPGPGTVVADSSLEADGVEEGTTLLLGPARTPVEVVGFVEDTRYSGQGSLWGSLDTWREVTRANRPGEAVGGDVVQALVVRTEGGEDVAGAIDEATGGATDALTLDAAIEALPGVSQQRSTFNQIIGVTVVIALVVVALFFALITVERTALYGILKAVGASGATLFGGVVTQAVVVTLLASAVGAAAALALDAAIPPGAIPFTATPGRLLSSVALLLVAAVLGSAFSLRRVLRIDPASAIGTAG